MRARIVNRPGKFRWSSYRHNTMGVPCELTFPHQEYIALARTETSRLRHYQPFFDEATDEKLLSYIRCNTNKGLIPGCSGFKNRIKSSTDKVHVTGSVFTLTPYYECTPADQSARHIIQIHIISIPALGVGSIIIHATTDAGVRYTSCPCKYTNTRCRPL